MSTFPRFTALVVLLVLFQFTGDVHAAETAEEGGLLSMIAKLLNFALLVGVLAYFLKSPLLAYLASRSAQIRQDLVAAAEMRATATSQLAEIEHRMRALPGELEALTRRGAEDVKAERERIAQTAAFERDRLLEHTRREIESRLRTAKRELTAHAADLAVSVARRRIERSITRDDQLRLVDQYAAQLQEAQ